MSVRRISLTMDDNLLCCLHHTLVWANEILFRVGGFNLEGHWLRTTVEEAQLLRGVSIWDHCKEKKEGSVTHGLRLSTDGVTKR